MRQEGPSDEWPGELTPYRRELLTRLSTGDKWDTEFKASEHPQVERMVNYGWVERVKFGYRITAAGRARLAE